MKDAKSGPGKGGARGARKGPPAGRGPHPQAAGFLEADISSLNVYGDGVFVRQGRSYKVARAVPGDRVRVKAPESDKRFVQVDLERIIRPSKERVDPACVAFGLGCGACQWLGLAYEQQLYWKTRIVRELFRERLPGSLRVEETLGMARPEGFRNKLSLRNHQGRAVFMQDFGDALLCPERCRVETPAIQAVWQALRGLSLPDELLQIHLRSVDNPAEAVGAHLFVRSFGPGVQAFAKKLLALGLRGVGASLREEYRLLGGEPGLRQVLRLPAGQGLAFEIPHNGFFQTNHGQAERLLQIALDALGAGKGDAVLDLYCGAGFFSLPLARRADRVLGVEASAASIGAARANAAANGLQGVEFRVSEVESALVGIEPGAWPLVLLDPPRSGAGEAVMAGIAALRPRRVVYVACSAESLIRDLKPLVKAGWRLQSCQPVDLFPHTAHVELVLCLEAPAEPAGRGGRGRPGPRRA